MQFFQISDVWMPVCLNMLISPVKDDGALVVFVNLLVFPSVTGVEERLPDWTGFVLVPVTTVDEEVPIWSGFVLVPVTDVAKRVPVWSGFVLVPVTEVEEGVRVWPNFVSNMYISPVRDDGVLFFYFFIYLFFYINIWWCISLIYCCLFVSHKCWKRVRVRYVPIPGTGVEKGIDPIWPGVWHFVVWGSDIVKLVNLMYTCLFSWGSTNSSRAV